MPRFRLERGPVVCEDGVVAATAWSRSKGLLGRAGMEEQEGLWIQPTSSIHMWFMRFPIDVVWAAGDGRVLKLVENIGPWRMSFCRGAKVALELPVGAIARSGVQVGDHLVIER
ncbi:MAG: uncharacterized protein QOJ31_289 [Gaiellales bacterium]|nr:uncharacterized protein [Gaiellales bacterium]MDX6545353.1 uncharacterized protein [Gaiellales bacterium]MDX6549605.1 uncharacterized protein [Gaiellales bacterium]